MRTILKRLLSPFLTRLYKWRSRSVQRYSKYGIELEILPSVFHPGYFLSTNILIRFLSAQPLQDKRLLELGAGNGLISFFAAKSGAKVTATDINPSAIEGLQLNAAKNKLPLTILEADLLEDIALDDFDYVIINPPYYPHNPVNMAETAFYCGNDFGYFTRLFSQLAAQELKESTAVFMILSEDCRISHILDLARQQGIDSQVIHETKRRGEQNTIYRLLRHEQAAHD